MFIAQQVKKFVEWLSQRVPYFSISLQEAYKAAVIMCFPGSLTLFYFFQIIGSVGFGLASDKWHRQTVLHWALGSSSLVAIALFAIYKLPTYLSFSTVGIALMGLSLNQATVSRGLLFDLNWHRIGARPGLRRQLMARTIFSESIIWVVLSSLNIWLGEKYYVFLLVTPFACALTYLMSKKYISDLTEDKNFSFFKEFKAIVFRKEFLFIATTIFFFQTAFFYFFYEKLTSPSQTHSFAMLTFEGAGAMAIGSGLLSFRIAFLEKLKDKSIIIFSGIGAVIGIFLHYVFQWCGLLGTSDWAIFGMPLFYLLTGSGLALPCFYPH